MLCLKFAVTFYSSLPLAGIFKLTLSFISLYIMSIIALKSHLITLVSEEREGVFPRPPDQCSLPVPFLLWAWAVTECCLQPLWVRSSKANAGSASGEDLTAPAGSWVYYHPEPLKRNPLAEDSWLPLLHWYQFGLQIWFSPPDSQGNQRPNASSLWAQEKPADRIWGWREGSCVWVALFPGSLNWL